MVFEAQRDHHLDLARSYFIGDKASDVSCGRNAGAKTILVQTGYGATAVDTGADWVARDLPHAAEIILGQDLKMSKSLGVIPARWGATRFPGKALHLIAGQPLLRRVWEQCSRARELDRLIIATDDDRIANAAATWGAEVALTSRSHLSGTDRVAEVARKRTEFNHIVNIQGDEPMIDPKLIDRLVRELRRDRKLGMITAASRFVSAKEVESPHQVKVVVDLAGRALYFSRAKIPAQGGGATSGGMDRSGFVTRVSMDSIGMSCCALSGGNLLRWNAQNRLSNCARSRME